MSMRSLLLVILYLLVANPAAARETRILDVGVDASVDIRVFPATGDRLLLGFACDEGKSKAEEKTAASLAADGIEVWMPDMLSAYMLPHLRSSLADIPTDALLAIIDQAVQTGKQVYLVASGPDTELVLRAAAHWEDHHDAPLAGAVLLFPRLFKGSPEPGKPPTYVDAVGSTQLPLIVLEGERTPNRWGLDHLVKALEQDGSPVQAKVIPGIRGYFFKRQDTNRSEEVVTSQLAGLIKVSLFYLQEP